MSSTPTPTPTPDTGPCWEFQPLSRTWKLRRIPGINPIAIAAACLLTHLGAVAVPAAPMEVLMLLGAAMSVICRCRAIAVFVACANALAVPAIVQFVPDGAEHVARVDASNLGPTLGTAIIAGVIEIASILYRRWQWELCIPSLLSPKSTAGPAFRSTRKRL
ncbi:hypothetical protein ACLTEW_25025 [Gordonia lacunae]|uniref:hypothetical protein n=1 Tax=Gordonia lacunae TaxID=417102 RepID=UPI0039E4D4E8